MALLQLANSHGKLSLLLIAIVSDIIAFILLDVYLEFQSTWKQHQHIYLSPPEALARGYRHKTSEAVTMDSTRNGEIAMSMPVTGHKTKLQMSSNNHNSSISQEECRNCSKFSSSSAILRQNSSKQKKKFIFIGYREHWETHPPFECECKDQSVIIEKLDYSDDMSNTGEADCLLFVLAPKGRLHSYQWNTLRKNRGENQKWLFASRESASTTQKHMSPPKKYSSRTYHISFTYHSKADLPTPYGRYVSHKQSEINVKERLAEILEKKVHLMSWMSSNCIKEWGRTEFVKQLAQLLPLHMYGTCGNMTCAKMTPECALQLRSYKFALVLENSCCSEYITEKFWNAFTYEQVPVVLGALPDEYNRLAPPNSYIHIEEFKTMTDLVQFIEKVDKDDSLYIKYHEWRAMGYIDLAKLPADFISSCHSLCRVGSKIDELKTTGDNTFHFDPFGPTWFGGCRNCDEVIGKMKPNSVVGFS